jgi:hypothetical protein
MERIINHNGMNGAGGYITDIVLVSVLWLGGNIMTLLSDISYQQIAGDVMDFLKAITTILILATAIIRYRKERNKRNKDKDGK